MLDQEQFDKKLDQIMRRQGALEARANALNALPDTQVTARSSRNHAAMTPVWPLRQNLPRSATPSFSLHHRIAKRGWNRAPPLANDPAPSRFAKADGVDNILTRLQNSLDRIESRQMAALNSVEDGMETRVRRMRGLGLRPRS